MEITALQLVSFTISMAVYICLFLHLGSCGSPNDLGLCAPVPNISGCSLYGSSAECFCLNGYYFAYPFCTGKGRLTDMNYYYF